MHSIRRLFGIASLTVALLWAVPSTAFAGDFATTLISTYTIQNDGSAQVTHDFSIENTVSTVYITNYAFEVAGNHINHLSVTSNGKKVESSLTALKSKSSVALTFPDKVVGKGQKRQFTVTYDTPDISAKLGKVLEVSIPRLTDSDSFLQYTVRLKVPSHFGRPTRSNPDVFLTTSEGESSIYTFSTLKDSTAISVLFGKEQLAKLKLSYHIENTTGKKGETQIALPADGTFQRVYYESIDPKPLRIEADEDGNWIATYGLESGQEETVTALLYSKTQPNPQQNAVLLTERPSGNYLRSLPFWPADNREIRKISAKLKDPESIYRYVLEHVRYDYDRHGETKRLGADGVLNSPTSAACQEFSDLFIALARASGIPAREVLGFAYTQNPQLRPVGIGTDTLHAWPEYFDETTSSWIAVDPTWEQTTGGVDYFHSIDFNRIVFAVQGTSSTQPIPAGMYKKNGNESKDVEINFVDSIPNFAMKFSSKLKVHPRALFGLTESYAVNIHNETMAGQYTVPIHTTITNSSGTIERDEKISFLPDEEKEIPVQLPKSGFFPSGNTTIKVTIGTQVFTHELTLTTTIKQFLPLIILTLLVVGCIAICAVITRRLLVPRWKR